MKNNLPKMTISRKHSKFQRDILNRLRRKAKEAHETKQYALSESYVEKFFEILDEENT